MNRFLKVTLYLLVFFIVLLFSMKNSLNGNDGEKNGFNRNFNKKKIQFLKEVALDSKNYYFSKFTSDSIILNDLTNPNKFLKLSNDFSTRKVYDFNEIFKKLKLRIVNYTSFDNNGLFISDGQAAKAYKINNINHHIIETRLDSLPFRKMEVINHNSFVLMSKTKRKDVLIRLLKKVNWQGKEQNRFLPQNLSENFFSADGFYKFSSQTNRLAYLYAYKGAFTILDTNLHVLYTSPTIDTVRTANVKLKVVPLKIKGDSVNTMALAGPPKVINRNLAISKDKIYIQSFLKADNENLEEHNRMHVIDVYNLLNGHYLYSFYIPRRESKKLLHYEVDNEKLFAIFSDTIIIYKI